MELADLVAGTEALASALRDFEDVDPALASEMRQIADELSVRLRKSPLRIGVVGPSRELLESILSAKLFEREPHVRILVRAGARAEYIAHFEDGIVEKFSVRVPDRSDAFVRAIARSEREEKEVRDVLETLAPQIEYWKAKPPVIAPPKKERALSSAPRSARREEGAFVAFLRSIWAWLLSLFRPAVPQLATVPTPPPDPVEPTATVQHRLPELTAALERAKTQIEKARVHADELREQRERHADERKTAFTDELRALFDPKKRGKKLREIEIEFPSEVLAVGFDLAIGIDDDIDARISIGKARPGMVAIEPANVDDLPDVLRHLAKERPRAIAKRAIERATKAIEQALEKSERAHQTSKARIEALEKQRILDPKEFRTRSLARVEKATTEAAMEVTAHALATLAESIASLRKDWLSALEQASNRAAVEAVVKKINEETNPRIAQMCDRVNDRIASELQSASDTMQVWLLEELHARYEVARRESMAEQATVIAESIDELDMRAPLTSVVDKFESERVKIGMGGAAAGAAIGTLLVPGIGTAIGAFLGTFAGFFKGIDSLKSACVPRLDACMVEIEKQLRAQIESRPDDLAKAIRASLEESLDRAMTRFERSIARLLELERRTLSKEHAKLDRLAQLRELLAIHTSKLQAFVSGRDPA